MNKDVSSAIKDLALCGIVVHYAERINSGINTRVYKVVDQQNYNYCLKFYKSPVVDDKRARLVNEINFLKYLTKCPCKSKVPKLIQYSISGNWSLLSWINGKQPITFDDEGRRQLVNLIAEMQYSLPLNKENISLASEACTSHAAVQQIMSKRFNKLLAYIPKNKLEREVREWFRDEVIHSYAIEMQKFLDKKNTKAWQPNKIMFIASPSDIGIHNTIKHKDILYFIDFEYSGLDDLSKLAGDLVLQPNCPFRASDEKQLLTDLKKQVPEAGNEWINRYYDLKALAKLKWVFIMLNKYTRNEIDSLNFLKVRSYFRRSNFE